MRHHRDGSPWERLAGYSRAVRSGTRIEVSGTTASSADGSALHPGDVGGQTRVAIQRGIEAIEALGGTREHVVRSRLFLVAGSDWEAASNVHAELLGAVAPANTLLFVAGLVGDDHLVEVELAAEVAPPVDGSST